MIMNLQAVRETEESGTRIVRTTIDNLESIGIERPANLFGDHIYLADADSWEYSTSDGLGYISTSWIFEDEEELF